MGETTNIEWADSTVNFWWGCTKVGPGCDDCYAEVFDKRVGGAHWGAGVPRRYIHGAPGLVRKLQRQADEWFARHRRPRRVFMMSMGDLFDNEIPAAWRREALLSAAEADRLAILPLTKRVSNVEKMVRQIWFTWPKHIGLMITVVNQADVDRDLLRLRKLKQAFGIPWVGLSVEPMLGAIDLSPYLDFVDWVICGGETGHHARMMHPDWPRALRDQCAAASVAFFFKQWGGWMPARGTLSRSFNTKVILNDGRTFDKVIDAAEADWGSAAEVLPFKPEVMLRVKKTNGDQRTLDGRRYDGYPEALRAA